MLFSPQPLYIQWLPTAWITNKAKVPTVIVVSSRTALFWHSWRGGWWMPPSAWWRWEMLWFWPLFCQQAPSWPTDGSPRGRRLPSQYETRPHQQQLERSWRPGHSPPVALHERCLLLLALKAGSSAARLIFFSSWERGIDLTNFGETSLPLKLHEAFFQFEWFDLADNSHHSRHIFPHLKSWVERAAGSYPQSILHAGWTFFCGCYLYFLAQIMVLCWVGNTLSIYMI